MAFSKESAVNAIEEAEEVERSVVRRTEVERSFFHMRKRNNTDNTLPADEAPLLPDNEDHAVGDADHASKDYKKLTNEDMDMKVSRKDALVSGIKSRFAKKSGDEEHIEDSQPTASSDTNASGIKSATTGGPNKLLLIGAAILLLGGGVVIGKKTSHVSAPVPSVATHAPSMWNSPQEEVLYHNLSIANHGMKLVEHCRGKGAVSVPGTTTKACFLWIPAGGM